MCLMIYFQFVTTHMSFLQYVLQEGVLYLPWNRAREIWSTLVASTEACDWDKEVSELTLDKYKHWSR